jgi:hypothetical protein
VCCVVHCSRVIVNVDKKQQRCLERVCISCSERSKPTQCPYLCVYVCMYVCMYVCTALHAGTEPDVIVM